MKFLRTVLFPASPNRRQPAHRLAAVKPPCPTFSPTPSFHAQKTCARFADHFPCKAHTRDTHALSYLQSVGALSGALSGICPFVLLGKNTPTPLRNSQFSTICLQVFPRPLLMHLRFCPSRRVECPRFCHPVQSKRLNQHSSDLSQSGNLFWEVSTNVRSPAWP